MEKNEKSEDWQLIVNGEYKPWPVVDYMSTPITINLNWGIDTSKYESTPITFFLKELLDGKNIPEVDIDKDRKVVTCSIPIREKEKHYKVLADFSPIKESLNDSLSIVVKGKTSPIQNRILILKGEEVGIHPMILYKGKKCKYELNDEEGIVKIVIPIDSNDNSNPKLKFKQKLFDSKYFLIFGLLIGFLTGILSTCNSKKTENETNNPILEDTLSQETADNNNSSSYSLADAIAYLDNHEVWEKSEMEKYNDLKGLFDAINEFKYHSIITNFSQLEGSITFRELEKYCNNKYHYESVNDRKIQKGGGSSTGRGASEASRNKYSCDENISIYRYMRKMRNDQSNVNAVNNKGKNISALDGL